MPIRTNRGRAAVYRRLWGWPMRTPRHLVGTLFAVAVMALVASVVLTHLPRHSAASTTGSGGQPPGQGAVASTPTDSANPAAPPQTRLSAPLSTPTSVAPAPQALAVIDAWGHQWVNHPAGMATEQWLGNLSSYTTPEFLATYMRSVNPSNIAATQVTGPPQPIASHPDSVEALLPTNAGNLDITAVSTPLGWQVNQYQSSS